MKPQKTYLWITISVLILIIIIAVYFYFRGKRNAEGPKVTYPQGGNSIPAGWSPMPLVKELYDAMSGLFSFTGTKDQVWTKLRDMPTDEMVIAVYDTYNQKYFSEGNGTLTQWIRDENYYDPISGVRDSTLSRLQNLGLE